MLQWIVSSSILILVVIGLRFLLRGRVKPWVQYALWAVVLARLLLPVQFGSTQISLQNSLEKAPVVQQMELADRVEDFVYHEGSGAEDSYYEYQPPAYIPPVNNVLPPENNGQLPETPVTPVQPAPQVFTPQEVEVITRVRDVKDVLTWVWVGGMIAMGLVFCLANLRFAFQVKNGKKDGFAGKMPVIITDKVETPCLFGLFRPRIYLPTAVAEAPRHREYSVAHELTHYRHGDALWSILRCVCIVVHWYNPLVWWAAVLSREDGEIACDEATIHRLGEETRADYGRVLVDLTCRKRTDLLQTATTMTGSAKGLTQRIKMIVKQPKTAIYAAIILILAVSIAVACVFTGSKPGDTDTPDSTDSTESTESTENNADTNLSDVVIVRHTEGATYDLPGKKVETDKMKDGYLYAINSQQTKQLVNKPVTVWVVGDDSLVYYCLQSDSTDVWRVDINTLNVQLCYEHGFEITAMHYFERKLRIVLHSPAGIDQCDYIMEFWASPSKPREEKMMLQVWRIDDFTYAPHSTDFADVREKYSKEDLGPTIRWTGMLDGDQQESREYYYFIETEEILDAVTFEDPFAPAPVPTDGLPVIYDGHSGEEFANCVPGYLYYWVKDSQKVHPIAEERVVLYQQAFEKVFFVKAAEPRKLYAAPLNDLDNHSVVYESDFGAIVSVNNNYTSAFANDVLNIEEAYKRYVVLDVTAGTWEVVMEQYYIEPGTAYLGGLSSNGKSPYTSWRDAKGVSFRGKLGPGEQVRIHKYYWETGEYYSSNDYAVTDINDYKTPVEYYQYVLTQSHWYYMALSCTFEKPEEISAKYFFYNGLKFADRIYPRTYTDEEKDFLQAEFSKMVDRENLWAATHKMPVAKMNEALSILNITVDDLEIPDTFVYYDKTDSYYVYHTDAYGVGRVEVTEVKEIAYNVLQIYWKTDYTHHNTATGEFLHDGVKMVMTIQQYGLGQFKILSNVPVA